MKTITENGIAFAYLGIQDVESLEAKIKAENTEALNKQLDTVKDPAQRMALWKQYQADRVTVGELEFWCGNTIAGMKATLALAATKAGSVGTIDYDVPNASNLALHLLGIAHRQPIVARDDTPKGEPNPTKAG